MAETVSKDLIRFLGESAQDLSMRASLATTSQANDMISEAEELMTLRSKLLQRLWDAELSAQLPLPLSVKKAA